MKGSPFRALLILAFLCLTHSCGSDIDVVLDQQDRIVSYLERNGAEYTIVDGTYRYIQNADREGRDELVGVVNGDEIAFEFFAYTFDSAPRSMFYTNVAPIIDPETEIPEYPVGLDWLMEPYVTTIGSGQLMNAIENGLLGCKIGTDLLIGDIIELYITSDLAYGDKQLGVVEPNTTLLYVLTIIPTN